MVPGDVRPVLTKAENGNPILHAGLPESAYQLASANVEAVQVAEDQSNAVRIQAEEQVVGLLDAGAGALHAGAGTLAHCGRIEMASVPGPRWVAQHNCAKAGSESVPALHTGLLN